MLLHYQISIGAATTFDLNADILEATIMEQKAAGRTLKAFFLVNPNNPLGEVYSSQLVLQLMEVCHRSALALLDLLIPGTFRVLSALRCGVRCTFVLGVGNVELFVCIVGCTGER
jgi:hypothetical protein